MNREEKIISWIEGTMNDDEVKAFQQIISSDPALAAEVDEYKALYQAIDESKLEEPSENLRLNFQTMLHKEMEKPQTRIISMKLIRNISAVAAVLIIGILVGVNVSQRDIIDKMDNQTAQLISTMQQNLQSESVTGRISAVQVSNNITNPETDVLNTLISTLKNDASPNVRLAAVEALNRHVGQEIVREAFVRQLTKEQDSFVLIAIINSLSENKVEQALDPLEAITRDMNQAKFIQDEAYLGIIKIQKI